MKKIGIIIVICVFTLIGVSAAIALTRTSENASETSQTLNDLDQTRSGQNSAGGSEVNATADRTGEVTISITDFAYQPQRLTIKAGTKVTWTNQDAIEHDITPDQGYDGFEQSNLLSRGDSYSVTFDTPGTYTYHCSPHPEMTATIVVE